MEIEKLHFKLKSLSDQHQLLLRKLSSSEEDLQDKIKDVQEEITSFNLEQKEVIDKIRSSVKLTDANNYKRMNGEFSDSDLKKSPVEDRKKPVVAVPIKVPDFKPLCHQNVEDETKRTKKIRKARRLDCPEQDNFLEKLGLVSQERFAEIKFKQQDRKRRTRSVPSYLLLFSTENEKGDGSSGESSDSELSNRETNIKRKRVNSSRCSLLPVRKRRKKEKHQEIIPHTSTIVESTDGADLHDFHELICSVCHDAGNLLMCDTCDRVYHLTCLQPSLTRVPPGTWFCPKCVERLKRIEIPDIESLKNEDVSLERFKQDLDVRRKNALTDALEIRRQRHNFGVQIRQFNSSHATQTHAKKVSLENIEQLKRSLLTIKSFMSLVNIN